MSPEPRVGYLMCILYGRGVPVVPRETMSSGMISVLNLSESDARLGECKCASLTIVVMLMEK